jgi:hypothetical protein
MPGQNNIEATTFQTNHTSILDLNRLTGRCSGEITNKTSETHEKRNHAKHLLINHLIATAAKGDRTS